MCAYCGRKRKASEMRRDGEFAMGLYCCPEHADIRHPQDFVRGIKDDMHVPWAQPPAVVFTSFDANFPVGANPNPFDYAYSPELGLDPSGRGVLAAEGGVIIGLDVGSGADIYTPYIVCTLPSWVIPESFLWSWSSGGGGIDIVSDSTVATQLYIASLTETLSGVLECLVTDSLGGQGSVLVPVTISL